MRGRRDAGEGYGSGRGSAPGRIGLNGGAQIDDLFFERVGRALHAVSKGETRIAESDEGFLKLFGLIVGRYNARGFDDTEENVVQRIHIARYRQHFADGSRSGVGIMKQRRQVRIDIAEDLRDVRVRLVADSAFFPSLYPQRIEGAMHRIERRREHRGEGKRRGECGRRRIGWRLSRAKEWNRRADC